MAPRRWPRHPEPPFHAGLRLRPLQGALLIPIPIRAFNPGPLTGAGNVTWLVPGRIPTLIDAGTGDPRHLDSLDGALGGERLGLVLVTHNHSDHASGAPALLERMPSAAFAKMSWPEKDGRYDVPWQALLDGQMVHAGDTELEVVHTPGHAPDHVCFWHAKTRALFSGDLAIQGTTVAIPASAGGDLAAYMASLERVLTLDPVRLYPAHGPVIQDPATLLRSYLDHRRAREKQIVDLLSAGVTEVDHLVAKIYPNLDPGRAYAARETIAAHLAKLGKR